MIIAFPKTNPPHVTVLPNDPVPSLPFNSIFLLVSFLRVILPNTSTVLVFTPDGVSVIRDAPLVLISSVPSTSRALLICILPAKEDVPSLLMYAYRDSFVSFIRNDPKTSISVLQSIVPTSRCPWNEALPSLLILIFLGGVAVVSSISKF